MALGRLHVIVDVVAGMHPLDLVDAAISGGAPVLQLRAKAMIDRELYALALDVVERCRRAEVMCLIDDRVDVALASGAAGVHVGEFDLPVDAVRRIVPPDFVVGATARSPESASALVRAGASYIGAGPAFPTTTKAGLPDPLGIDRLAAIAACVDVPVIAIGGVNASRAEQLTAAGCHGVAVVGAVSGAADPVAATAELLHVVTPR